jgi:hypothetical protein
VRQSGGTGWSVGRGPEARIARDLYQLLARMNTPPATAADRFAALEAAASRTDGLERFYALVDLAKVAFEAGDLDKATAYAQELLQSSWKHSCLRA